MRKSVFCNKFPSMHLIKSIKFTSERSTNCLPVHLSNHQIWFFESKSQYSIDLFFKKNVISQVLALTRDKTWPFFHKKLQINKFGFLNFWGGLTFFYPYYIFLTMDGLSKCPPPQPPPENSDLLVYFTHWRLYWTSIFQNIYLIFHFCCSKLPITNGNFLPFLQITS